MNTYLERLHHILEDIHYHAPTLGRACHPFQSSLGAEISILSSLRKVRIRIDMTTEILNERVRSYDMRPDSTSTLCRSAVLQRTRRRHPTPNAWLQSFRAIQKDLFFFIDAPFYMLDCGTETKGEYSYILKETGLPNNTGFYNFLSTPTCR